MNYVNLIQRIRACESEVTAQLVLEKWIERFQYTVGVDIGKQHDHCHVVVVCKHFEGSPAFVVYSQDLTAQIGPSQVSDLTDNEIALIHANYPHPQGFARAVLAKFKEKNHVSSN